MKIEKLALPDSAIDFLKSQGYEKLYPPQADCVKSGLLDGKSILVSAPTASGKTLIAMLAMLSYLSKNKGKVIYLSPLRALAAEKFTEFKKLEKISIGNKIKTTISTGEKKNNNKTLENSNVLILTNEKMDSILKTSPDWIDDIGLVISDEVHLIGDQSRGPTLEMVLTHLKLQDTKPQIIGLSATITNSNKIAKWLDCKLVKSTWRPVPLSEGVCDEYGKITMMLKKTPGARLTKKEMKVESEAGISIDLGVQSVKDGDQSLVFASTRANSKNVATKAAKSVSKLCGKKEITALDKASEQIKKSSPTTMIQDLANLVKQGVAFHHAGLNPKCREIVEKEFRNRNIKFLSSTPTLAAGVNLPAKRVVISSISRYDPKLGRSGDISVLEYKQFCGRAGRPQYDDYGESIIVTTRPHELIKKYIRGKPEHLKSEIMNEQSLQRHVLSLIVMRPGITREELVKFFLQTFGGTVEPKGFGLLINYVVMMLFRTKLIIKKGERYAATLFGKKISLLSMNPKSATEFRDVLNEISGQKKHTFGFLHLITNNEEFFPNFSLRKSKDDFEIAQKVIDKRYSELINKSMTAKDCSRSLLALQMWISESSETKLSKTLGIEGGDMHTMIEKTNWLCFCLREISKILERFDLVEEFDELRKRVVYGIREELLDLVRVKGIGRIRARVLFKNNIKNLDDLANIPVNKLAEIDKIGLTIANNIKAELKKVRY
jgi:helicase